MLPYRSTIPVCDHCRLRRRRCDRGRPKCSFCVSRGVQCVYEQPADSQPSQLVQELMNIRERLEYITPLVEPQSHHVTLCENITPFAFPRGCPPLVIKSAHLMQILGLPSDLACVLYRLERHSAHISDYAEHRPVGSADFILHTFYAHTHQLYPVLHPDFTLHFRESSAAGFPPSTMSCLSLLVASLAHISHDQTQSSPFEVALSMLSIVIQEHSVTSVQCLLLFSLYSACLIQPRQAYDYIQSAFLKIQPFFKSTLCGPGSPESPLIRRLYWTIHIIESELSMHLSLSSIGGTMRGHLAMISLPTNTDVWDWSDDPHSLSRLSSSDGSHISEAYSRTEPPFHLSTEIQIQTVLNKYTSSRMDDLSASKEILDLDHPLTFALDMLCPSIAPDSPSQPISQHIDGAVCRAKYHLYEVSIYWPVIYRIIINGSADPELLPYAPLFFQSVTSLLGSANLALRICLPKTWFLCASIYIVCIAAIRAVEVRCLRLLCQPQFWEHIDASIDALHRPSMLSPSVLYMRESLKARLEGINIRYRA